MEVICYLNVLHCMTDNSNRVLVILHHNSMESYVTNISFSAHYLMFNRASSLNFGTYPIIDQQRTSMEIQYNSLYSNTCVKRPPPKRPKYGFLDRFLLNAGQKYCRMLKREHTAILSTFIKLPVVIKTFVLSIFG